LRKEQGDIPVRIEGGKEGPEKKEKRGKAYRFMVGKRVDGFRGGDAEKNRKGDWEEGGGRGRGAHSLPRGECATGTRGDAANFREGGPCAPLRGKKASVNKKSRASPPPSSRESNIFGKL